MWWAYVSHKIDRLWQKEIQDGRFVRCRNTDDKKDDVDQKEDLKFILAANQIDDCARVVKSNGDDPGDDAGQQEATQCQQEHLNEQAGDRLIVAYRTPCHVTVSNFA